MKKLLTMMVMAGLVLGVGAPAFAQSTTGTSTPVEAQIGGVQSMQLPPGGNPSGKALVWTGAGVFIGGMGVALFGFMNNENGRYSDFGEATASNKALGAAGIATAFAGGALMAIGQRVSRHAPDVQVGVDRFAVSKRLSW